MSSPFDHPPQKIDLKISSNHPELLEGLDIWLHLGLISDIQVRQICRENLSCRVQFQTLVEPELQPVLEQPLIAYLPETPKQPAKPNVVNQMLQSLGAELSVRWLLFLGVFLVVLSSGVLAASQWERFPAAGQYGVLFAYTLSFWGLSFWAGRQNNLRLTAQTLLIVTLLLVPVNFWAMDSFGLWRNPLDWLTVAIASSILTVVTVLLCNHRAVITNAPRGKLPVINILGLSYLHWGWQLPLFPVAAIYVAMVGTTIITITRHHRHHFPPQANEDEPRHSLGINLYASVIIYALLLLLGRGIFVARVDVTQLGLAIGICGWLATWLAQQRSRGAGEQGNRGESELVSSAPQPDVLWGRLGGILLFLGWFVAVFNHPAQAIGVSGLALWVVTKRLHRYSRQIDLLLLFLIGLQAIGLGWRLVPSGLQQLAVTVGTQLTHSQNEPWALLSVVLFPYLLLMVVVTERLHRDNKAYISHFGEIVNLLFGTCLTTIATVNPSLRSLNLLLSTITLVVVSKRRSRLPVPLVYLTHTMGLLTFSSIINWLLPNLALHLWASILLVLMVAEWGYSLSYSLAQDLEKPSPNLSPTNVETFHETSLPVPPSLPAARCANAGKGARGLGQDLWWLSAWYMGFALATVSFFLLWTNTAPAWQSVTNTPNYWGLIWLTTPVALTVLATRTTQQRTANSLLSVLAVGVAQFLTLPYPGTRLIGLAVGAGVMYANNRYLRSRQVAGVTIGLGLSFIAALLWEGLPGLPRLAIPGWYVVGAIATISLWLGKTALSRRDDELARIYAAVSDKWAIALCTVELLFMTLHSSLVYQGYVTAGFGYLIATAITLTAIIYRSWRQPTDWAFYGIGWGVELLVAEVLGFGEHSIIRIAIANIALGLFSQILGEWWRRRYQLTRLPRSFHILPLMYGAFSVVLRLSTFTDWSGLCSLGVALIFVGVGRRNRDLKPLLYLGIIGISISAYELLFYQMLQASGGGLGDGLIAMAALGTSIMSVYRVLAPWLGTWLRLTPQELKGIAHLHWVWSSGLLMTAVTLPIEVNRMVGLGTGAFLISYAILQGKQTANENEPLVFGRIPAADLWVYLGFLLVAGMRIYWRETAVGELLAGSLVPWNGAIACVFAYFLYILPWQRWGWSKQPWQIAAYILPLVVLAETRLQVYPITLVIAAGYYIFLSKIGENIRFTYISVALIDWALFLWLDSLNLNDGLWYVTIISLSLLYLAQVDPALRHPENKLPRHTLRIIASGVTCGWAMLFYQHLPLIPGGFALIAIFAGLALRVRAFLTVGTGAFFITSIYQLVIFSLRYSFLKWVVGLLVGIALISIAANFETHRTQITSLLRNTSNEFEEWE